MEKVIKQINGKFYMVKKDIYELEEDEAYDLINKNIKESGYCPHRLPNGTTSLEILENNKVKCSLCGKTFEFVKSMNIDIDDISKDNCSDVIQSIITYKSSVEVHDHQHQTPTMHSIDLYGQEAAINYSSTNFSLNNLYVAHLEHISKTLTDEDKSYIVNELNYWSNKYAILCINQFHDKKMSKFRYPDSFKSGIPNKFDTCDYHSNSFDHELPNR